MKEERIRELALEGARGEMDSSVIGLYVDNVIRKALAERDQEVAEWAKKAAEEESHGSGRFMVPVDNLLAFLEAWG